jgi:hypothetical protein
MGLKQKELQLAFQMNLTRKQPLVYLLSKIKKYSHFLRLILLIYQELTFMPEFLLSIILKTSSSVIVNGLLPLSLNFVEFPFVSTA